MVLEGELHRVLLGRIGAAAANLERRPHGAGTARSACFGAVLIGLLVSCDLAPKSKVTPRTQAPVDEDVIELVLVPFEPEIALYGENVLHLYLNVGGELELLRGSSPRVQKLDLLALVGVLESETRQNVNVSVGLRVDPRASIGHVVDALVALRDSPVQRSVLNAPPQGEWSHWPIPKYKLSVIVDGR